MPSKTLIRALSALGLALVPVALLGCDSNPPSAPAPATPGPAAAPDAGPPSGASADAAKAK